MTIFSRRCGWSASCNRQPGLDSPAITVDQVLTMATANAAAPTGFGNEIGVLEPGRRADMVLVRLDSLEDPYLDQELPPVELVLGRAKSKDIAAVIVDGEVLLQDGVHNPRPTRPTSLGNSASNWRDRWNRRRWQPDRWRVGSRPTWSSSTAVTRRPWARRITSTTAGRDVTVQI